MEPDSVGGTNWTAKLVTLETLRPRDNSRASSLDTMISEYLQKIVKRATTVIEEGNNLKELYKIRGAAYEDCDQCDLAQEDFEKAVALPDKKTLAIRTAYLPSDFLASDSLSLPSFPW